MNNSYNYFRKIVDDCGFKVCQLAFDVYLAESPMMRRHR